MIHVAPDAANVPHQPQVPNEGGKKVVCDLEGRELQLAEYIGHQAAVAARGFRELLYPGLHKPINNEDIPLQESLLELERNPSWDPDLPNVQCIRSDTRMHELMNKWSPQYAPLFSLMTKEYKMPVEEAERKLTDFYMRLVEHMQHIRDLWRLHTNEELSVDALWDSIKWMPYTIAQDKQDKSEDGVKLLKQTVLFPHVVSDERGCRLELDQKHLHQETLWCALNLYPPVLPQHGPEEPPQKLAG